jgi:hypothetical protein
MSKIRMNTQDLESVNTKMLNSIEDFSFEAYSYYDTLNTLLANPNMKGKFLEKASNLTTEVKENETKLKTSLAELTEVIKRATITTKTTEETYAQAFKDLASDHFEG